MKTLFDAVASFSFGTAKEADGRLSIIVKDVVVVVVVAHHGRVKLCFFWCCWCRDGVLVLLANSVSLITVEALEKATWS